MNDDEIKTLIGKNITYYRTESGMRQSELAQKLNYSDKSISKWERGDGIPDVIVLKKMGEIFNITLNDFLDSEHKDYVPEGKKKKIMIPIISVVLCWFVVSIIFSLLKIIASYVQVDYLVPWLIFIWTIPISSIILLVFSKIWWTRLLNAILVSLLNWSLSISLYLTFSIAYPVYNIALIFLVSALFQLLTVLWFAMKGKKERKTANL